MSFYVSMFWGLIPQSEVALLFTPQSTCVKCLILSKLSFGLSKVSPVIVSQLEKRFFLST